MTGRGDKVEEGVHAIVAEAGVTLDARLFCEDIVVLPLDVTCDFTKAKAKKMSFRSSVCEQTDARKFVIDIVTESGRVNDCE